MTAKSSKVLPKSLMTGAPRKNNAVSDKPLDTRRTNYLLKVIHNAPASIQSLGTPIRQENKTMQPKMTTKSTKIRYLRRISITLVLTFALLCLYGSAEAQIKQLLYTVTDQNELAAVDVVTHSATIIGITQDTNFGPARRIRGLAYDDTNSIMYGMTREGDLVTINRFTGQTTLLYTITPNPAPFFWSGLAFDGIDTLYTTNAFGTHNLFKIVLSGPTSVNTGASTVVGPTDLSGSIAMQILGLDFYPSSAPVVPPTSNGTHPAPGVLYGSNRTNDNIAVVNQTNGAVTFPFGGHGIGVRRLQEIAFHPGTGELYAIHDHFSQSNNAALSVYNFTTEMATEWGELPFGILENAGGGNSTYGWGGLTFAPSLCVPPPNDMVAWFPFDEPWTVGAQQYTAANIVHYVYGIYFPFNTNGPTPTTGKVGGALNFDGIKESVIVGPGTAANFGAAGTFPCIKGPCRGDFSIDAWIRLQPSAPNGVMTIVEKRNGRGYSFFIQNNRLRVQIGDPVPVTYSSPLLSLKDGLWHHVAVTVKRRINVNSNLARIRFYYDGVLVSQLSPPTKAGSLVSNNTMDIAVRTGNPFTNYFKGDIDELEIFNRELSPGNVSQIFQADYFGKCK